MNKLRCIIAEDEPIARKIIREFVEQIEYLEFVGEFENVLKAEAFLKRHEADILFLDIEMPRLSGVEYLRNCKVKPLVIITTAYPEYALEGYTLDVVDYLLKPIAFNRFFKAAEKAREIVTLRANAKSNPDILFVRCDNRLEKIILADVLYFESSGNYVSIVLPERKLLAYLTLKSLEEQLPVSLFFKVHRSFLVNFAKIEKIEENHLVLAGKRIPISRNYSHDLSEAVNQRLLRRK
jgi:DNA-binding LytR/AlgR family response regulator